MNELSPKPIGRLARQQFSSALMSDAKWRKLMTAVEGANLGITQMLVKFIDVDEPRKMKFPPGLQCPHAYMDTIESGAVELRAIEWLQFPADVRAVADALGRYPLEALPGGTRVVGYRR